MENLLGDEGGLKVKYVDLIIFVDWFLFVFNLVICFGLVMGWCFFKKYWIVYFGIYFWYFECGEGMFGVVDFFMGRCDYVYVYGFE